jgi:hypothetical protein
MSSRPALDFVVQTGTTGTIGIELVYRSIKERKQISHFDHPDAQ